MKFFRIVILPLAFFGLLAFGGANGQQPPGTTDGPQPLKPSGSGLSQRAIEVPATVEALVTRLEALRKQKAEIEKQEKAIIDELKKVYKQLEERLTKLGVLPPPTSITDIVPLNPGSVPKSK
jgi:hypothetical protein